MIQIKNVSKSYGKIQALKNVDLEIKKGELFGLLGPNGAGKTTLINIINTFMPCDAGDITINGLSLKKDVKKIKKMIGIIPQEIALYEDLTALENLKFWGEIYGIKRKQLKKNCENILEMVGLSDRKNDVLSSYSGGMKRRINIAAGLLHDPDILLMDEPTVGVDPQSRNFIFDMIEQLNSRNKTMIYTTHYMEEAERLCQRIAIIDRGKIIALGTKEELYDILEQEKSITFKFNIEVNADDFGKLAPNFRFKQLDDHSIMVFGEKLLGKLPIILEKAKSLQKEIVEIDFNKPNLEKVFLKLTGRELRDD